MDDRYVVTVHPKGSHEWAEKNSAPSARIGAPPPAPMGGWTDDDLDRVVAACRHVAAASGPPTINLLPGLHVYPGDGYIAVGVSERRAYAVIRGGDQEWRVTFAADRDGESVRGVRVSHIDDAVNAIFHEWFVRIFFPGYERDILRSHGYLWNGWIDTAAVTAAPFSWKDHRELFSPAYQQYLHDQHRAYLRAHVPRLQRLRLERSGPRPGRTLYRSVTDPQRWILGPDSDDSVIDLTHGLAGSSIDFLNLLVPRINHTLGYGQ